MDRMDFRNFMLNPAAAAAARQFMAHHSAAPFLQHNHSTPPSAATGTPPSGNHNTSTPSPHGSHDENSDIKMKHSPDFSDSESDTSLSNSGLRESNSTSTPNGSSVQPSAALGSRSPSTSTSHDPQLQPPGVAALGMSPHPGVPTSMAAAAMLAAAGMQSAFPMGMAPPPSLPVFPGQASPFSPAGPSPSAAAETPPPVANAAALAAANPMAAAMLGKNSFVSLAKLV